MRVEGACHCGHIRFTAEVDPATTSVCHCTDCQMLSGSAFRVSVRSSHFALQSGTPTTYIKTAESGAKREHGFCPRCGTPIYATSPGPEPKAYSLRTGTFRPPHTLAPARQIWTRSRVSWLDRLPQVPGVEKQS